MVVKPVFVFGFALLISFSALRCRYGSHRLSICSSNSSVYSSPSQSQPVNPELKPTRVRLFIKPYCPWCSKAEAWLNARGIPLPFPQPLR